ncbi:MAG: topoisomerase protein [Parcubacteria group bacterium GW2011_GWA2_47_12]|nr:MAG: topoisomerase protein [Parcubacteria group bacterium GW2011_GWA2_47_12]
MAQKLLIVESPAKAKTIGKYLGVDFAVKASVGHVRDLPKSSKNAVDIAAGFVPHYEISKGKEKTVADIAEAAASAKEIILATDADREGEAIAWHIAELLKKAGIKKPITRAVYHEITKHAIEDALAHPRAIDQNLRRAQEARRVLDRLVGYDLSGLIWKKLRYGLSAGRVQSPALRILAEREREIKAFVPETFWRIFADTNTVQKAALALTCEEEPREKSENERILAEGKKGEWFVKEVSETEAKRSPRPPFITSTLQQVASTRLGFSPKKTMLLAQKLYESGFITYMRTDSTNLSEDARRALAAVIEKSFGKENIELRHYAKNVKNAQEAHEAIRPTDVARESAGAIPDQKKLYELIRRRTIASQMLDAGILRTKIIANIKNGTIPDFSANGSRIVYSGWLLADPTAKGDENELPKVVTNEPLTLRDIRSEEKQTEPPARYSEAGLVKELEKRGIGRPSTYASIIDTLLARGYTEKEGRALRVTETGEAVSAFIEKYFGAYISDSFTAEMEDKLDDIAGGTREYEKTMREFYTPFNKEVKKQSKDAEKITSLGDAPSGMLCPLCESPMEKKLSRIGAFFSCKKFPECKGARSLDGSVVEEKKPDVPIGAHPETQEPIFVKIGRFGPYVQLGEKKKGAANKPKLASIPKDIEPKSVDIKLALKLLSLPRLLGVHPTTNKEITASRGRFGPYIVHNGDFRSLKTPDNPYDITLPRALEILKEEKKKRGFKSKKS